MIERGILRGSCSVRIGGRAQEQWIWTKYGLNTPPIVEKRLTDPRTGKRYHILDPAVAYRPPEAGRPSRA
jgi:hypothetical protein